MTSWQPAAGDDADFAPDTAQPRARSSCAIRRPAKFRPWSVHDRTALAPGARIAGPAIIAEDETSTLVSRGWSATVNDLGYLELTQERA